MKKLQMALVAVALTASASVAVAQEAQPQGQRQGGRPNVMVALMQGITLTADQQAKVDTVAKKYDEQRAAIRADQTLDMDARRAKSRELTTKQVEEVKTLLNDEQKKVFDKNWTEAQARMQGGGGRPPQA
jgi:Spy/CpxP family protein refolding chaperone